jgi:HlyD family secretion protein
VAARSRGANQAWRAWSSAGWFRRNCRARGGEAASREAHAGRRGADSRQRAGIDAARARLERTLLRAPFAGTVAEINGEIGEFVTPSPVGIPTPPAVDVVDNSCIYITAPIDEVDAPRVREGMPAHVTLDAFKDRTFPAHVRRVAPYVLDTEKQARTVEVEAEVDERSDAVLLPGYSADVEVIIAEHADSLRIPTRALVEGNRVYVLDGGRIRAQEVVTGIGNWEYTEVTRGVDAGQRVVVSVDREGLADGVQAVASDRAGRTPMIELRASPPFQVGDQLVWRLTRSPSIQAGEYVSIMARAAPASRRCST